jgi:mannose-6-phosphate isomerase-like protein (cupin superfamily)
VSGFVINIESQSITNTEFRRVLFTAQHFQLAVLSLGPGQTTGPLTQMPVDQFIQVNLGRAKVNLGGQEHEVVDGWAVLIPAGTEHRIINTSRSDVLKLFVISALPYLPNDSARKTTAEAPESVAASRHSLPSETGDVRRGTNDRHS